MDRPFTKKLARTSPSPTIDSFDCEVEQRAHRTKQYCNEQRQRRDERRHTQHQAKDRISYFLLCDYTHRFGNHQMASGLGVRGTMGRCYGFWADFKQCQVRIRWVDAKLVLKAEAATLVFLYSNTTLSLTRSLPYCSKKYDSWILRHTPKTVLMAAGRKRRIISNVCTVKKSLPVSEPWRKKRRPKSMKPSMANVHLLQSLVEEDTNIPKSNRIQLSESSDSTSPKL